MKNVLGLVNFHDSPDCLPLTANRPLGSTSFLGRYAFCDFALSNLCNSGIAQVGLMIKDHQRSILKHLGSMDSWVINTKIGHQRLLYNEPAQLDPRRNTDVNNLLENDWLLYDSSFQYLVVVPAHLVINIDLRPFIEKHIRSSEQVTVIAGKVDDLRKSFIGAKRFEFDEEGKLSELVVNLGDKGGSGLVDLGIYIINRTTLLDMIHHFASFHPGICLADLIWIAHKEGDYRLCLDTYDGYVRSIDSFQHYMEYSLDLLDKKNADQLFLPDWPIYTLTHDTPPAMYGVESSVRNSYVSNGSIIEGTVINSIIARNVRVEKGAVVKNSIVFSSTKIDENANVENALVDKYSIVLRGHSIKGKRKDPIYVAQGTIL